MVYFIELNDVRISLFWYLLSPRPGAGQLDPTVEAAACSGFVHRRGLSWAVKGLV